MEKLEKLLQSYGYGTKDLGQNERVRNMRTHQSYLDEVRRALNRLRSKV